MVFNLVALFQPVEQDLKRTHTLTADHIVDLVAEKVFRQEGRVVPADDGASAGQQLAYPPTDRER